VCCTFVGQIDGDRFPVGARRAEAVIDEIRKRVRVTRPTRGRYKDQVINPIQLCPVRNPALV